MRIGPLPVHPARALALLVLVLLATGCGKQARDWRRQLRSPDSFERFVAALALCEAHPRQAAPAIRVLFEALESEDPRNSEAADRALQSLVELKLADLIEFLVVAGPTRALVRARIVPLVRAAGPGTGELLLDAARRNDWPGPPEVREMILERARSEPAFREHLLSEQAAGQGTDSADQRALSELVRELRDEQGRAPR